MRFDDARLVDALCGEYLLGTLRGLARRRFERALREDPRVALRLTHWERLFAPRYSKMAEVQPSQGVWKQLERELGLSRYRPAWHRRLGFWRGFAAAVSLAAVFGIALQLGIGIAPEPQQVTIAQLAGKADAPGVLAIASSDRTTLHLQPARPVIAGPAQSYELWLIPAEGGAPLSLAVLGNLEARIPVAPAHARRMTIGAKLAVSVEPAGGSPTGAPTGPVIMAGQIES